MRRWLVVFLAAAAALLSFDALRAHALDSGVIPAHAVLPREALASIWALVIDAAAAAGILGVRADAEHKDWRAWLMLTLAFTASVGFQVWTPPTALARAVPPVVLALAIVVLELPRRAVVGDVPPSPAPSPAAAPPPATVGERAPDPEPVAAMPRPARGAAPRATGRPSPAALAALDRAKGDPAALARVVADRGIDPAVLPPRHAAALNGHDGGAR